MIKAITLLVLVSVFCIYAESSESIEIERSSAVSGDDAAIKQAGQYIQEGANYVSIHHPFMNTDAHRWTVEGHFYK